MPPLHDTPEQLVELVEQDLANAKRMAIALADHWESLPRRIIALGIREYRQRSEGVTNPLLYVRAGEPVPAEVKEHLLRELLIPTSLRGLLNRAGVFGLLVLAIAGFFISAFPPQQAQQPIPQPTEQH